MKNFEMLGLPTSLVSNLQAMNFVSPTPIQEKSIPPALEGRDILGSAQTGTGKTLAFGIPLVNNLILKPQALSLVITPTRELAMQVLKSLSVLLKNQHINTVLLIGGEDINKQLKALSRKPRLIVGTPGRINDHLQRKSLFLQKANFLVLDETDRMLDMGFSIQINAIMDYMPSNRQMLLFSATLPSSIVNITKKYLNNPLRVSVGSTSTPISNIKQEVMYVSDSEKYTKLLNQLDIRKGSIIVFVKTKVSADKIAFSLRKKKYNAEAIHGDLRYNKRKFIIEGFHKCKYRILVATDIAARGLDIPHIEHVINYDLPQCPEDYIHRIGRTARAGAKGEAICFVSPGDKRKWQNIECLMDPTKKVKKDPVVASKFNRKKRSFNTDGNNIPKRSYKYSDSKGGSSTSKSGSSKGGAFSGVKKDRNSFNKNNTKSFQNINHHKSNTLHMKKVVEYETV